jgi:hypothetical protein
MATNNNYLKTNGPLLRRWIGKGGRWLVCCEATTKTYNILSNFESLRTVCQIVQATMKAGEKRNNAKTFVDTSGLEPLTPFRVKAVPSHLVNA